MNWFSNWPEQIRRLSLVIILIVGAFLVIRPMLVPDDFGEYGHFRSGAMDNAVAIPSHFAGKAACNECHDDMLALGYHKSLSCEVCHGPLAQHTEAPDEYSPQFPDERSFCPTCHEYLKSRPTGFPQVVSQSHNPTKPCISCHDPHNPVPPESIQGCAACHGEIATTKSLSHHAGIECGFCHIAQPEHMVSPHSALPSKPDKREFCGQCHAAGRSKQAGIPQIDLQNHEPRYTCWQCHYPHLPEL